MTHNLPRLLTRFFGREGDIARVKRLLEEDALVTLTGPGGIGKTRLALRVAEEVLPGYADGAWYIELAPIFDPALAPQQVASSLGVRLAPNRTALDSLVAYLRSRRALLLLDNCEHLLEACAHLAELLLHACPGLKILGVSRESLGVMGEAIYRLPSLPFPDPAQPLDLDGLGAYAAVSLFIDRAQLVQPDFCADSQNASHLARICQRLEGIPLAIEMAAAWMTLLSPGQLLERLDDSFRLLSSASHTTLPRQQTLRATIDWSYALLSEAERLVLQRLSVFAGGCTLEAAEAVCSDENLGKAEALEALAGLVDKSLVIADRQPGEETRYRLLQMVLQYAGEKLGEGEASTRARRRHRDYFLAFAEANIGRLETRERSLWIGKCEAEHENLRQALEWSFGEGGDAAGGLRLIRSMEPLWSNHYPHEALQWFLRGINYYESHPELPRMEYAWFLYGASFFILFQDPVAGIQWVEKGIAISRSLGEDGIGALICNLMMVVLHYGWVLVDVPAAQQAAVEARALIEQVRVTTEYPEHLSWMHDDVWYPVHICVMQYLDGLISLKLGHYEEAIDQASQSLGYLIQTGDLNKQILVYTIIGESYLGLRAFDQARESFQQALDYAGVLEDNRQVLPAAEPGVGWTCGRRSFPGFAILPGWAAAGAGGPRLERGRQMPGTAGAHPGQGREARVSCYDAGRSQQPVPPAAAQTQAASLPGQPPARLAGRCGPGGHPAGLPARPGHERRGGGSPRPCSRLLSFAMLSAGSVTPLRISCWSSTVLLAVMLFRQSLRKNFTKQSQPARVEIAVTQRPDCFVASSKGRQKPPDGSSIHQIGSGRQHRGCDHRTQE